MENAIFGGGGVAYFFVFMGGVFFRFAIVVLSVHLIAFVLELSTRVLREKCKRNFFLCC